MSDNNSGSSGTINTSQGPLNYGIEPNSRTWWDGLGEKAHATVEKHGDVVINRVENPNNSKPWGTWRDTNTSDEGFIRNGKWYDKNGNPTKRR